MFALRLLRKQLGASYAQLVRVECNLPRLLLDIERDAHSALVRESSTKLQIVQRQLIMARLDTVLIISDYIIVEMATPPTHLVKYLCPEPS